MLSILVIAGARPNFMKVAPLIHEFSEYQSQGVYKFRVQIVHTGQHYDESMSDIFFKDLGIPKPDFHLGVGSGSHAEQTANIMMSFEKILINNKTDLVIVVGDVNSTIACALTAKKMGVKVAHVEAGLRSFDMSMPEEVNRKLTDAISDMLFVTEESGIKNLEVEGVGKERIYFVGNVMIDTLIRNLGKIENGEFVPSQRIKDFCGTNQKYSVMTLHRPSNVDSREAFLKIWEAVINISRKLPILFPVHPRTRAKLETFGIDCAGINIVDPIGYLEMLYAVKGATLVLTDSGGLQEETTVLGVPCLTIRENTERPITVEVGTNYLVGTNPESIVAVANDVLSGKAKKGAVPPYWDGKASGRIVKTILEYNY